MLLGRLKKCVRFIPSSLHKLLNSVVKIFNLNARVTKNIELTSKVIVFPVKVVTKIFSRENQSKSNYAKFFCLNVTKKGLQMRDYCLNFEACKQPQSRRPDKFPAGQTHAQSLIGWLQSQGKAPWGRGWSSLIIFLFLGQT